MTQRSIEELERILNEAQDELKAKQDPTDRVEIVTCGECGLSWNDAAVSSVTPAPSARCPFEYYHKEARELRRLKRERSEERWEKVADAAFDPVVAYPRRKCEVCDTRHEEGDCPDKDISTRVHYRRICKDAGLASFAGILQFVEDRGEVDEVFLKGISAEDVTRWNDDLVREVVDTIEDDLLARQAAALLHIGVLTGQCEVCDHYGDDCTGIKSADEAREAAIDWQHATADRSMSLAELINWQAKFEALAEKFGLTEEFKENGII